MSGLRSSRNLSAPPTLIRAGIRDLRVAGLNPWAKSFHLVPHMSLYIAWAQNFTITNAEFNRDTSLTITAPHQTTM